MEKDYEIEFVIDGVGRGTAVLMVRDGKLLTDDAEQTFYKVLRNNEKELISEAEDEEKSDIVNALTKQQETKLQEAHAKNYHGTDDDMSDAFEDWLEALSLSELKALL